MTEILKHAIHTKDTFRLSKREGISYLFDHLTSMFWFLPGNKANSNTSTDQSFFSNENFWGSFLSAARLYPFEHVTLEGFHIIDWFPRSPGLAHTLEAKFSRRMADEYFDLGSENVYTPLGKAYAIMGGIGSYRFQPFEFQGTQYVLSTATSDGFCHTGIPLAMPMDLYIHGFDFNGFYRIDGKYQPLSGVQASYFPHMKGVPRFYFQVEQVVKIDRYVAPVHLTPVIFMKNEQGRLVSYCTTFSETKQDLEAARDWLQVYANKYHATILTDYDQQMPNFENVTFRLQDIVSGNVEIQNLLDEGFTKKQAISMINKRPVMNITNDKGNITVVTGDNYGIAVSANSIESSFTDATMNSNSAELTKLLQDLITQIDKLCTQLEPEEATVVRQDLEIISKEVHKDKPSRRILEIKFEALKKAAEKSAAIATPVITIAGAFIKLLFLK